VFLDEQELIMEKDQQQWIQENLPIFNNFRSKLRPLYYQLNPS